MLKPQNSARLKLKRAKEHIDDLSFKVRQFCESGAHKITVHCDADTGREFLGIAPAQAAVPAEFSLILGDVLHNLSSALDHAWYALTALDSPDPRKINFPIFPSRQHLVEFIDKRVKQPSILAVSRKLLDHIQPYKGGNGDDLYRIHHLNITDKHKLLIPQVQIGRVEGVRCEDGDGVQFTIRASYLRSSYTLLPCKSHRKVKVIDQGQSTVTVVVKVGTAKEEFSAVVPIIPALVRFRLSITNVLDALGM